MAKLWQDLRYGIRTLFNKPGFTAVAVMVLALGIGANTAVFSLVNALLFKPLAIQNPRELVGCFSRDSTKPDSYRAFSYPNYADLRDENPVFASLMAHNLAMVGLLEGDQTRRVFADIVSSNYFSTLGVAPFRGRTFTSAEERPGSGAQVVMASYPLWRKTGADPELVGKTLHINGRIFTVVGITQPGFSGTTALVSPDLYVPLGAYEIVINDFGGHGRVLAARDNHDLILVGRLRPGVSAKRADTQLAVVATRMARAFPAENRNQALSVSPLSRLSISTNPTNGNQVAALSALLLSMSGVVLLIASLNLANMMLARGTARRKEIAIRLAIGGGRGRIVRQLFTEGLLLALLGGAAGLLGATWSTAVLVHSLARLAPIELVYNAGPDLRILAATLGFCVLSTILFGLGPAWKLSKADVISDLKASASDDSGGAGRRLFSRRNLLAMAQISLSLMMLTAAGLFVRSAMKAAQVEPGFRLENGILAEVDPSLAGYDEANGRRIYGALLNRLRSIPGVESAGLGATVPFGMMQLGRNIQRSGDTSAKPLAARSNIVSADYFATLGIPVLRGRPFLPTEAGQFAIIDKLAAERIWPGGNPVGKRIRMDSNEAGKAPQDLEVVGVVGNVQENIVGHDLEPHIYVPFGQYYQADMQIHLKTAVAGEEAQARLLETVRREIRAVDDRLPVLALKTLRQHLDASFDLWIVRTGARMFGVFGAVALLLAVIGLYAVKAYAVARRTREIGIRMALGARSGDNLRMVMREGIMLTAIGTGTGLVLSLLVGRALAGMLYQVSAADPLVFSAAPIVLAVVSPLACYFPARRAARVDPMVALRYE